MTSSSSSSKPEIPEFGNSDWELRPGGMLVQKRERGEEEEGIGDIGPLIRIKVAHDTYQHDITLPAKSTFGELKRILAPLTGLEPDAQRLLFRGKEKNNEEYLHMAGVKDMSKVVLLQDPACREQKLEQIKRDQENSKVAEAILVVRSEVDELAQKVAALESAVHGGTKVEDKEFLILTELLMVQLLKLDGIEAEGEARLQRRNEVRRIQSYVDTLDALKARNSNPTSSNSSAVSVTTQWETFDSGVGSLNAPPPMASSTQVTNDWEQFN